MLEINDKGQLEVRHELGDWGVPACMDVESGWEKDYKKSIWYKDLAKEDAQLANAPSDEPLQSSKQVAVVMKVLAQWNKPGQITPLMACAIANWLGGSWKWEGRLWMSTASDEQGTASINPQNLTSDPVACGTAISIGDALLVLKKMSVYAHAWVVSKAVARAKRQRGFAKANENQAQAKAVMVPIAAVAKLGEGVASAVEGAGEGLKNTGDVASFLAKYGIYIAGGVGAIWLYLQYRKIKAVESMAGGAGAAGLAGLLRNPQQNYRPQHIRPQHIRPQHTRPQSMRNPQRPVC